MADDRPAIPDSILRETARIHDQLAGMNRWQEDLLSEQEATWEEVAKEQAEERAEGDRDRELARRDWEESQREREAMAAERAAMAEERERMDAERRRNEEDRQVAAEQRARDQAEAYAEKRRQFWRWVVATLIAVIALGVAVWGQVKPAPAPTAPPPSVSVPAPAR